MFPLRAIAGLVSLLLSTVAICRAGEGPRVVAYVPNWIDLPAFAERIDHAKITHLNVAFENPVNDSGELSFNEGDTALLAKAAAHGVPVLVSIGGGSASENPAQRARYFDLLTPAKRAGFVSKLSAYITAHGFAGLDVDLEGPAINGDYGAFIADLAAALQPHGKLLTAALSQGYGGDKVPDSALAHFDFVNVMAYDATGPWNPDEPGQHSSRSYAKKNARYWIKRGLPASKVVLGVPFYGYGFGKAFRQHDYSYKQIVKKFPGAEQFDQIGGTIWYNGLPTIRAKAAYARTHGLGGIMIWPLDYDAPAPRSLLDAIHEELRAPAK